jgi:ribosome-associated protein
MTDIDRSPSLKGMDSKSILEIVEASLNDDKAEDIVIIDLKGKTSIADYMVVASGRSERHVKSLADHIFRKLKTAHHKPLALEGMGKSDWVLLDAGDVIIHMFPPEIRELYNLEKLWSVDPISRKDDKQSA